MPCCAIFNDRYPNLLRSYVISSETRNLSSIIPTSRDKYKISPCGRNDRFAEFDFFEVINLDKVVKSQKHPFSSFPRKRESSDFSMLWMPDQVRHDGFETSNELIFIDTLLLSSNYWQLHGF